MAREKTWRRELRPRLSGPVLRVCRAVPLAQRAMIEGGPAQLSACPVGRPTMTPDGISDSDWHRVHALAADLVNVVDSDEAEEAIVRGELFTLLDQLDDKYGPKPSLLATRADCVESAERREELLLTAYSEASRIDDATNRMLVAQSLAELYIEECRDFAKGAAWLATWRFQLGRGATEHEKKALARLERLALPER